MNAMGFIIRVLVLYGNSRRHIQSTPREQCQSAQTAASHLTHYYIRIQYEDAERGESLRNSGREKKTQLPSSPVHT